jgi:hypothetical protein
MESNMWGSLLIRLYQARQYIPPDVEAVINMVSQLVEASVTKNPFPTKKIPSAIGTTSQPNVDALVDFVRLCISTNNLGIYPKIFNTMDSEFALDPARREYRSTAYYIPLAKKLKGLQPDEIEHSALLSMTVSRLILVAVNSSPAFPVKPSGPNTSTPDTQPILDILDLCLSFDNPTACSVIFTKMKNAFDRLAPAEKDIKMKQYYLPLLQEMEKSIGTRIQPEAFASFYQVVAYKFFDFILPQLVPFSPSSTQVLILVFKRAGHTALTSEK